MFYGYVESRNVNNLSYYEYILAILLKCVFESISINSYSSVYNYSSK